MCGIFICLGSNLVQQCQKNLQHFKDVFITIGTVEQKPVTVKRESLYEADKKDYTYYNYKEYGKVFDISELMNLDDVTYISKPERRAFYHCFVPGYKLIDDNCGTTNDSILEASPEEDCIPDGPVRMTMKNVLFSVYKQSVKMFYFCDHHNPHPQKLYKDKTYIMSLQEGIPHGFAIGNPENNPGEYKPMLGPISNQSTADGTLLPTDLTGIEMEEVNDEFYKKGRDKLWEAYAKEYKFLYSEIPVTATNDLNLIMAFYNGDVGIKEGKVFSKEDYTEGNQVCLVSARFARRNKISIGDKLPLSFRAADYSMPPSVSWYAPSLKADGKNYEEFYKSDYTVIGTYNVMPGGASDHAYQRHDNEVIIPEKSIKADNSDNIAYFGRYVSPYNTSFRIPNGTIDDYMKAVQAKGIDSVVDIKFYDKGYSELESGILQMERMAYVLLIAGIIMAILVLLFFCHMMISGQKKRTAIERSLGVGKRQCLCSLTFGILIIAFAGCLTGCLAGATLTETVASAMQEQKLYSDEYSAGSINPTNEADEKDDKTDKVKEQGTNVSSDIWVTTITFILLFSATVIISGTSAWRNLKYEPLELLSGENN